MSTLLQIADAMAASVGPSSGVGLKPSPYSAIFAGSSARSAIGAAPAPTPTQSSAPPLPQPVDESATLDEYGFAKACNECHSSLDNRPNLVLRYSSCCGLVRRARVSRGFWPMYSSAIRGFFVPDSRSHLIPSPCLPCPRTPSCRRCGVASASAASRTSSARTSCPVPAARPSSARASTTGPASPSTGRCVASRRQSSPIRPAEPVVVCMPPTPPRLVRSLIPIPIPALLARAALPCGVRVGVLAPPR